MVSLIRVLLIALVCQKSGICLCQAMSRPGPKSMTIIVQEQSKKLTKYFLHKVSSYISTAETFQLQVCPTFYSNTSALGASVFIIYLLFIIIHFYYYLEKIGPCPCCVEEMFDKHMVLNSI